MSNKVERARQSRRDRMRHQGSLRRRKGSQAVQHTYPQTPKARVKPDLPWWWGIFRSNIQKRK